MTKIICMKKVFLSVLLMFFVSIAFAEASESKKNSLKDFLGAAGLYGVSHMLILT